MEQRLSTQPYKGTSDWLPGEFSVQKYIFDTWRETCLRFGYKEYLTPLLENVEIYRAKSGAVKEELFTLTDRADRQLAIRPEMTPSVTRMVASVYKESPKPLRLFSIANFLRNEAPQRGRTREFWQLNADIFGDESLSADIEILTLALELMLAFGAPKNSFKLFLNNRLLLEDFFSSILGITGEQKQEVAKILDKYAKIKPEEFAGLLTKVGLTTNQIKNCTLFLTSTQQDLSQNLPELSESQGLQDIKIILTTLEQLGYTDYVQFNPSIIRGFDYYNGLVFEVFDMNPNNNRSMFGGGRYNGLSEIFGLDNFPASGFAPGNITTELFLRDWNLLPKQDNQNFYYLPLLDEKNLIQTLELAKKLRAKGWYIETELSPIILTEALRRANKRGIQKVIILGQDEIANDTFLIKDLATGKQHTG